METEGVASPPPGWLMRVVIGRNPKTTLLRMAIWVLLLLGMGKFVLMGIRVEGISMLPTLPAKKAHLVNRLAYLFHAPQRGDIVAIKMAGEHAMLLKRIIGLPGETVAFHDGKVLINGEVLDEPYLKFPCHWEQAPEQVGADELYVVGDNRSMDILDHEQGRAYRKQIVGKLLL